MLQIGDKVVSIDNKALGDPWDVGGLIGTVEDIDLNGGIFILVDWNTHIEEYGRTLWHEEHELQKVG